MVRVPDDLHTVHIRISALLLDYSVQEEEVADVEGNRGDADHRNPAHHRYLHHVLCGNAFSRQLHPCSHVPPLCGYHSRCTEDPRSPRGRKTPNPQTGPRLPGYCRADLSTRTLAPSGHFGA